jgi:hypothetical protein
MAMASARAEHVPHFFLQILLVMKTSCQANSMKPVENQPTLRQVLCPLSPLLTNEYETYSKQNRPLLSTFMSVSCEAYSTLKMEAIYVSEMSVEYQQNTPETNKKSSVALNLQANYTD